MRFAIAVVFALVVGPGLLGCKASRPSEERCRLAVQNIRALTGTDRTDVGVRPEAMIRSCRANSTKQAAECMISAKTLEDLEKCEGGVGGIVREAGKGDEPVGGDK